MTDHELLLAISDIVGKKIKAEIEPVKTDIRYLTDEQTRVNTIIENEIRPDIKRIDSDVKEIRAVIDNEIRPDIKRIDSDVKEIRAVIDNEIRPDIKRINIIIENEIRPDIKILAENYLPAAKRYEKATLQAEAMQADIDVMKNVIREHSEKIQKIS